MKTLYGLVLAGGKSLRMGTDKSLLNYHGKSQREVMFDMLSGYCSVVYLSVNQNQNTYLPHIIDETEAAGPLGGIVSAFEK